MIHITSELQVLRARVEVGAPHPAVILVTSAVAGDGKSLTAFGLAACLGKTGYRTVVINSDSMATVPNDRRRPPDLRALDGVDIKPFCRPSKHGPFSTITLGPTNASEGSRAAIERFVTAVRAEFDYTIVDTDALPGSNLAIVFAQSVDAIVVSICLGRAKSAADATLIRNLNDSPANVLGVVAVSKAAVTAFAALRTETVELPREVVRVPVVAEERLARRSVAG